MKTIIQTTLLIVGVGYLYFGIKYHDDYAKTVAHVLLCSSLVISALS